MVSGGETARAGHWHVLTADIVPGTARALSAPEAGEQGGHLLPSDGQEARAGVGPSGPAPNTVPLPF